MLFTLADMRTKEKKKEEVKTETFIIIIVLDRSHLHVLMLLVLVVGFVYNIKRKAHQSPNSALVSGRNEEYIDVHQHICMNTSI